MKPFRFLQFNMQFGQSWDETKPDSAPVDLDKTIAEIQRHDADLIHLQEVENVLPGGRQATPPPNYERLRAAFSSYHSTFTYPRPDSRELPFGIGLAIFSRTPLRAIFREDLPSPPIEFDFFGQTLTPTDRVLLGATTTLQGRTLQLLNTHLLAFFMLKTSSIQHGNQRQRILEHLQQSNGPTLLSGDFNVRDHESLTRQFAPAGFSTVQTAQITWRRQPFVLDHVFHNQGLRCVGHQVIPTPASDHHALVADFVFA